MKRQLAIILYCVGVALVGVAMFAQGQVNVDIKDVTHSNGYHDVTYTIEHSNPWAFWLAMAGLTIMGLPVEW